MPARALYYPEWSIAQPTYLAESLLHWDALAVIVPHEGFVPQPHHHDDEIRRLLHELHAEYVTPIVPTEEQKEHVHERLALIFDDQAPAWLQPQNLKPTTAVTLAIPKFRKDTTDMLVANKWARPGGDIRGVPYHEISASAGNIVMAALAHECSSGDMPPITSDPGGFVTSCNMVLKEWDAPQGLALGERVEAAIDKPIEADIAFLVEPIPRLAIQGEVSPKQLSSLLAARRDPGLDAQRVAFNAKLDTYLTQLRAARGGERDVIRDQFLREYKLGVAKLERELDRIGLRSVFSKEGLVAMLIGVAAGAVAPALGLAMGLGGILETSREKRREALEKSWVSWAYGIDGKRLTLR